MTDYIRSKDGSIKPPEQLFELWGKCLDIWDEFLECQNKSEVSRRMGWYDRNRSAKCVEEISKYLKFTQRLIDSTTDGTFLQVAAIPFTEGKTRKQRELKRKKT